MEKDQLKRKNRILIIIPISFSVLAAILLLVLLVPKKNNMNNGVSRTHIFSSAYLPITGPNAKEGQSYKLGLETGLYEFNQENNGFKRELVVNVIDSASVNTSENLEKVFDNDNTFVVLGFDNRSLGEVSNGDIPILDLWNYDTTITNALVMRPSSFDKGKALGLFINENALFVDEQILFVKANNNESEEMLHGIRSVINVPNYDPYEMNEDDLTYTEQMKAAKLDAYTAIISLLTPAHFVTLTSGMVSANFMVPLLIPQDNLSFPPHPLFYEKVPALYISDPLNTNGRKEEVNSKIAQLIRQRITNDEIKETDYKINNINEDALIRGYLTACLFGETLLKTPSLTRAALWETMTKTALLLSPLGPFTMTRGKTATTFSLYEQRESSIIIKEVTI